MKRMELKWWFVLPLALLTVGSSYWLLSAVGLNFPPKPVSLAGFVLLFIVFNAFRQLYSHLMRVTISLASGIPST